MDYDAADQLRWGYPASKPYTNPNSMPSFPPRFDSKGGFGSCELRVWFADSTWLTCATHHGLPGFIVNGPRNHAFIGRTYTRWGEYPSKNNPKNWCILYFSDHIRLHMIPLRKPYLTLPGLDPTRCWI